MNNDERFQQRWEFRRREVDGDTSSDDNGSNSSGDPNRNRKLVTDLVLVENDEASDDTECQRNDKLDTYNNVHSETVKADEKKVKSSKKKKVVQKKSEGRTVKENKRKRKLNTNEMLMLKDLKIFADSLIQELAVAQENMFAHMRDEMRKLVAASRSNLEPIKKNVRRSQKKKVCPQNGNKIVRPQNCFGESILRNVESNVASDARKFPKAVAEAAKNDQVLELTTTNELHKGDILRLSAMAHTNLAYGSDHQVVFSSHYPLPTVLPKPQFQKQRNHIHLNDHIPSGVPMNNSSGSKIEIDKLMAAKRLSHRIAEFQPEERFGSFSQSRHKSLGLLGQNSSHTTIQGIGFPIPLIQGTDNGSNMSSLTYCENSFMVNNGVGPRINGRIARFPGRSPVSSERMIPNSIISKMPHTSLRNEH